MIRIGSYKNNDEDTLLNRAGALSRPFYNDTQNIAKRAQVFSSL